MATYILKTKTSDLSGGADFYREISADAETAGSITVTVANGSTETSYGFTKPYKPSNSDWETGSITVEVKVTTANTNMFLKVSASRLNSAGVVQETSSETAEQQLSTTGVKTFTIPSMNWAAGNCTDRIRINYIFRSANSHGGAINVVIETGTTDTEVTTSITENAGTCRATFVKNLRQYKPDHKTIIAEGGTTNGDGVSNNIYLDSLIASRDNADKLTHKIEVEPVGTAFDNAANRTARQILYDPSSPKTRRSHSLVYDSVNKRYLLFGGWNGTTRYNEVWELSADDRFGSSPPQWRKLNPSGTPPSARTTHLAFFDATGNRMIIHGGYDGADKNDTYALDVTTRYSEAWSTLSPTGTAPAARSQASGAFKASTRKAYVQGGLVGASDYRNDLFELDLSTANGAWTQLKAEDAAGNPPSRADHSMVFDTANNRLLIFGGYDGTNRLNDLWRWDVSGASFAEVSVGTPPGVRQMHVA
ncbi:MAG: kelch repeat-containing protein, partial [bacterium]|nr:kelch repeat-containing protein [bacterium]